MAKKMELFRLVVLGDGGVDKTALITQFMLNHYVETYNPTIEDSYRKQIQIDNWTCMVEVLDTAGQEEYSGLRDQWIRDGEGFVIVYSITSRSSFTRVLKFYNQICRIKEPGFSRSDLCLPRRKSPIILVGNHCERPVERKVSTLEGSALAREFGCDFLEVSAKNCVNVDKTFYDLIRQVRKERLEELNELRSLRREPDTDRDHTYAGNISRSKQASTISGFWRLPRFGRPRRVATLEPSANLRRGQGAQSSHSNGSRGTSAMTGGQSPRSASDIITISPSTSMPNVDHPSTVEEASILRNTVPSQSEPQVDGASPSIDPDLLVPNVLLEEPDESRGIPTPESLAIAVDFIPTLRDQVGSITIRNWANIFNTNTTKPAPQSLTRSVTYPIHPDSYLETGSVQISESQLSRSIQHQDYESLGEVPYKHLNVLGQGRFGFVEEVEATLQIPGASPRVHKYARKTVVVPRARSAETTRLIRNEIDIMKRLDHRHIIKIYATYTVKNKFAILMSPVADMNLAEYLIDNPQPSEDSPMRLWFGCLAASLNYLHEQRIKHRDIKPANILVRGTEIILTDFGIAHDVWDELTTSTTGTVDFKTPMYCAPEVVSKGKRGRAADIFSLGCVFLEMTTVLMWRLGCSLAEFHEMKVTQDGRKAYHLNLDKTLQWILKLFALAAQESFVHSLHRNCIMLEWCFAMLQPLPANRVAASEILHWTESNSSWGLAGDWRGDSPPWMGDCCRTMQQPYMPQLEQRRRNEWRYELLHDPILKVSPTWDTANEVLGYVEPPLLSNLFQ